MAEEIRKLAKFEKEGLITAEEFAQRKRAVLGLEAASKPDKIGQLPQKQMGVNIPQRVLCLSALVIIIAAPFVLPALYDEYRAYERTAANTKEHKRAEAEAKETMEPVSAKWEDPTITSATTLRIKGLSIGMSKHDARIALHRLGFQTVQNTCPIVGRFPGNVTSDCVFTYPGELILVYDHADELIHVEIAGGMIDWLFNVADMDLKQFAQTMVNEYQLGSMESFLDGNLVGWKYRDEENGVELVVYTGGSKKKRITFHSIPKGIERRFD